MSRQARGSRTSKQTKCFLTITRNQKTQLLHKSTPKMTTLAQNNPLVKQLAANGTLLTPVLHDPNPFPTNHLPAQTAVPAIAPSRACAPIFAAAAPTSTRPSY